jgi:hypothetical protein
MIVITSMDKIYAAITKYAYSRFVRRQYPAINTLAMGVIIRIIAPAQSIEEEMKNPVTSKIAAITAPALSVMNTALSKTTKI